MEYRHGPIAIAEPGRAVWVFGEPREGSLDDVGATGARRWSTTTSTRWSTWSACSCSPCRRAEAAGLDPDRPRSLTRSVVLARVILCVCLSPAVDLTYRRRDASCWAPRTGSARCSRPGGKAVNVARMLHALGEPVAAAAAARRAVGCRPVPAISRAWASPPTVVPVAIATRRTVTVVDDGRNDRDRRAGQPSTRWPELVAASAPSCGRLRWSSSAASVPSGRSGRCDEHAWCDWRARGRLPVIVDTSGDALVDALSAGPTIVKPNADELAGLTASGDPVVSGAPTRAEPTAPPSLPRSAPRASWRRRPPDVGGDALPPCSTATRRGRGMRWSRDWLAPFDRRRSRSSPRRCANAWRSPPRPS